MTLIALLSLCACLSACLLAARVVTRPSDNPPAAWALALFLISLSAFVADEIAYMQNWFERYPHLYAVANPLIATIFPSLYLYVRGLTHPTARWSRGMLAHFVIPLLAAALEVPTYFQPAAEKVAAARAQIAHGSALPGEMLSLGMLNLYAILYAGLAWRSIHVGRERIEESAEEGRSHAFRGLEAFVALFTALTLASAILDFTPWRFCGSFAVALAAVVAVFTALWLLTDHQPLLLPHALPPLSLTPKPAPTGAVEPPPPTPPIEPSDTGAVEVTSSAGPAPVLEVKSAGTPRSILRPVELQRLQRRLNKLLVEDEAYLDAELSLQRIAERAETTRHKMSAAIREIYGLTFYQLLARLRVQEAARRLGTKAAANRTIADIAFSVGFNTLSAFNSAFKVEFGVTPSVFRERAIAAPEQRRMPTAGNPSARPEFPAARSDSAAEQEANSRSIRVS